MTVSVNSSQLLGDYLIPALITFVLLLLTSLAFFVWRKLSSKANTILLVGLIDSGKSAVFTKLINPDNQWLTYNSMKENAYTQYLGKNGELLNLVDFPGAESFRKGLFDKWLTKERKSIRCVVFVIDSSTYNKRAKDVAEFLYDVIYESGSQAPILVACNKQDIGHAKSSQLIKSSLEEEFGQVNVSRKAALSSTTGESTKRLLSDTGTKFKWSDLKNPKIEFIECSAKETDNFTLDPIRKWIDTI